MTFSHSTLKARVTRPASNIISNDIFVLHSSEVMFLFLIKKSTQKATEIEIAFFHSIGNPKGRTFDHFYYALHIRYNFPYKVIPISMS